MWHPLSAIAVAIMILGCQTNATATSPTNVTSSPTAERLVTPTVGSTQMPRTLGDAIERGRVLYFSQGCYVCHGEQGEGDVGPALASTSLTLTEVRRQLRNPREFMPAYIEEILSDEQIRDLYAFERSLPEP